MRSPRHVVTPTPPSFCYPATTYSPASPTPTTTPTASCLTRNATIVVVVHPSLSISDVGWTSTIINRMLTTF